VAEGTIGVAGERSADARGSGSGPALLRASAFPRGPVTVRDTGPDALSNLIAVLELAADGQVRCSAATRRPLAATVRLVEDVLVAGDYYDRRDEGEPIAAFAWPMLLQAGGLAALARGDGTAGPRGDSIPPDPPGRPPRRGIAGPRLEPTPRGEAVLAQPSYQALRTLWERWLRSVSQDELGRIETVRGQRRAGTLTAPARRRAALADGLAALVPGAWVEVDALFAVLRAQPAPLVVAASPLTRWRLYLEDPRHGSLGPAGATAWNALEGRYALCALFEYAATLGVVDVAYTAARGARDDYRELWGADGYDSLSRYDGLAAVRVNELGAAILHDPGTLPALRLPLPRRVLR
jgi:hypothetical protein